MKSLIKIVAVVAALAVMFGVGWLAKATGAGQVAEIPSLEERERAFVERMTNVVLVGHFTIEGAQRRDGVPERYEISSVEKLDDGRWRFNARLKYMSVDVTLPIVLPMEWAGDTPMISITDFAIPGLGEEFGSRVLFYDGRYAGTWDHGEYGGVMYGTIAPLVAGEVPIGETPVGSTR
ncbi:MAG: hypothetical protein VYE73_11110 [Acidobacteriota bacterium]|nr:hypothetical protein [Acidobacteriota bacterium]